MIHVVWIAGFGALGVLVRHGILLSSATVAPWMLLFINVSGSAGLGLVVSHQQTWGLSPALVAAVSVGFFGGLTTFSGFAADVVRLMQEGRWFEASSFVVAHNVLSIVACFMASRVNL
jgi:fluoride exporter